MNIRISHRNKTYGDRYHEFIGHSLDCDICIVEELACCSNHSLEAIDDVIFSIDNTIADMGKEFLYNALYGYKIDECKNLNAYTKLKTQKEILKKHFIASKKNATSCLTCTELEITIENVKKLLGHSCNVFIRDDIKVDSSNKSQWDIDNPYCVSREKWEALSYHVCEGLGIDISITPLHELCDITFNTVITPQLCDIIEDIRVIKQNCDTEVKLVVSQQQCELDYRMLIQSTSCDLNFELYKELLDCNLSANIIKEIYSCDMKLETSSEKQGCAVLVTVTGTKIDLCSLTSDLETELINNPNC